MKIRKKKKIVEKLVIIKALGGINFRVYITEDISLIDDMLGTEPHKHQKAFTYQYDNGHIVIAIKPKAKTGLIFHEVNHAVNLMLDYIGHEPDRRNCEIESYLLEYSFTQIQKCIKKHKKTFK